MFAALACALCLLCCRAGRADEPSVPRPELESAPTRVVLEGRAVLLSASLYRDFMPSVPPTPKGKPLTAILAVEAVDQEPFPADFRVDRAWVLHDGDVWEVSELEEQDLEDPSYKDEGGRSRNRPQSPVFRVVARGGPLWGPNVRVDCVVRLSDGQGRSYLLRAEDQGIAAVQ